MTPIVVTPPAKLPVSLAEVRAQLRIDASDDDPNFAGLIAAATSWVERRTGRALIRRTLRARIDAWPVDDRGQPRRWLQLPNPPLISVASFIAYDDADSPTTIDPSTYYVDTDRSPGRLTLRRSTSTPAAYRAAGGLQITWDAGYGDNPGDVEEELRLAVLIMVGWFSESRGDETSPSEMPLSVKALIEPYLVWPLSQDTTSPANGVRGVLNGFI